MDDACKIDYKIQSKITRERLKFYKFASQIPYRTAKFYAKPMRTM